MTNATVYANTVTDCSRSVVLDSKQARSCEWGGLLKTVLASLTGTTPGPRRDGLPAKAIQGAGTAARHGPQWPLSGHSVATQWPLQCPLPNCSSKQQIASRVFGI